ncbi:retinoblastoma-like protein 1 [Spodoptera frugiperda]|uniref:Retinoblastoma-like protein 1 n=1 Tax=Spodoptera frugiperda TaxID=7108 RepID=A0A9R0CZJ7_SPOFR|nr:retinoblastoma-like protein 1 [Spodoptera frugiperda]XP_035434750.2 retinoblastoma-like protein 1 [Spodoptera frugiperda]
MSNLDESEENLIGVMDSLCSDLNVDPVAAKKAKDSFLHLKRHFTLDGDTGHWMACALYVACRTSITPTVQSGKAVEGNCVSLTKLLRLCNISLIQFFKKIKNWMEMALMSTEFRDRISHLEHKFAVSTVLYRNFQPIFQQIFSGLTNEPLKPSTLKRRSKNQPCTTNALYEFTWCLYICVKGEFHKSAHDLVDMYHLLLACLDFVFANAFLSKRTDVINPAFKGLPKDWLSDDFKMPNTAPCIMSTLCEIKNGLLVDAASTKEYSWKPVVKSFFEKQILKGDKEQLSGVLDVGLFDQNLKSLNNLYETYVLSVGEFDERIFLGEHANEQIGTSNKVSGDEISQVIATFGPSNRACHETPLTGRRYLARRDEELTPVSEAKNSLARLASYLRNAKPQPSRDLLKLFSDCNVNMEAINTNLVQPCNRWMEKFANSLRESNTTSSNETISFRCNMVTCLYYKVFEHIIREEHRKKPQVSLNMLLTQETYQLAVYACCTEIVLHAYGFHSLKFPKVLQIYGLSAFHFYKIIELVVQAVVEKLSRDVIKHLNAVEEEVLESLVWTSDSPLWDQLSKTPVPASMDVKVHDSPHRRTNGLQSPVSSVMDRYLSPIADQAKKQLFKDNIKPGQSLLVATNTTPLKQEASTSQATPGCSNGESNSNTTTPKKTNNSLILFFRKFYSLAVVRVNDLCTRLRLTDEELKKKIWTCLEYSVMHQTQLMKDRHLDQILMCAVYVICRVSNNPTNQVERTFTEIMHCYRQRPLADNHVYRSVLIKQSDGESSPERGDLINFYNKVYVQCMQNFALRFTGKHKDECSLSPLPAGRGDATWSPAGQRVSERHQLYVKPLTTPPPPHHHLTYRFSRSPAKDLHAINTMVSCEVGGLATSLGALGVKRGAEAGGDVVKRARLAHPSVARRLQGLMTDRQAV